MSDTPIAVRALIPHVRYIDKRGIAHSDVAGEMLARYADLIEESGKQTARIRELEAATSLAYGWLWHVITDDSRVHTARSALLSVIDKSAQSGGIQAAKDAGAVVTIGRNHE